MESKQRKKKKLGSYPYLSVVFSIFLSLVVIGLFGLLFIYANKLTTIIKENIEIQVYLKKGISDNQRIQVQKTLSAKDYVAKKNNELQIRYVSKEQAAEKFIKETGEDFSTFLGDNPLRDAYVVKMASESQSPEVLEQAKKEIEKRTCLKRIGITCVGFNMRKAARLVTKHFDSVLEPTGLRSTQFHMLATIARHENMAITRLANLMVMDRTTLTRNLKPLEKMGYITGENGGDHKDRRKRAVRLTPAGHKVLDQAIPLWEKAQENNRNLLANLWRFVYGKRYLGA